MRIFYLSWPEVTVNPPKDYNPGIVDNVGRCEVKIKLIYLLHPKMIVMMAMVVMVIVMVMVNHW